MDNGEVFKKSLKITTLFAPEGPDFPRLRQQVSYDAYHDCVEQWKKALEKHEISFADQRIVWGQAGEI